MKYFGVPGIGGSLGKCAVCGENFLVEIILNKTVKSFSATGIEQTMYIHDKCKSVLKDLSDDTGKILTEDLPDGPLKAALTKETA